MLVLKAELMSTNNLGLVLFLCFGRPGTYRIRCSELQVWGRGGLLEVLMVVWRGVQSGCGVFFQTCSRTHSDCLSVADRQW